MAGKLRVAKVSLLTYDGVAKAPRLCENSSATP